MERSTEESLSRPERRVSTGELRVTARYDVAGGFQGACVPLSLLQS